MSALCPHNISLVTHISFVRCYADIVRTYISRDICPQYILLWFSAQVIMLFESYVLLIDNVLLYYLCKIFKVCEFLWWTASLALPARLKDHAPARQGLLSSLVGAGHPRNDNARPGKLLVLPFFPNLCYICHWMVWGTSKTATHQKCDLVPLSMVKLGSHFWYSHFW